jgi:hypothetical protein
MRQLMIVFVVAAGLSAPSLVAPCKGVDRRRSGTLPNSRQDAIIANVFLSTGGPDRRRSGPQFGTVSHFSSIGYAVK